MALWLEPREEDRQRLLQIMEQLRARFGGPAFEPHVTVKREDIHDVELRFTGVSFSSEKFRACVLEVEKTIDLGVDAPHLSLLYRVLDDKEREEARTIIPTIDRARFTRVSRWRTEGDPASWFRDPSAR
jgi:hypothetical protein